MFKRPARGFTLIELLVVIAIIIILAGVTYMFLNPLELKKRGQDSDRMADLTSLNQTISVNVNESETTENVLCPNTSVPCSGSSHSSSRDSNGSGWVKINVGAGKTASLATLPVDPINNGTHHFTYCSDGKDWELNTVLESEQQKNKMGSDGGNEDNRYEVGSNLSLIGPSGSCSY